MRYTPLSKELYIGNRQKFNRQMKAGGLAIFNANDIMPTSADGTMPFRQQRDLFYLTGVDQEETILLLFPDAHQEAHREILFLKETSEEIAIWEGAKLSKEQATERTGIKNVQWVDAFDRIFHALMHEANCVYLNSNEHTRADITVETRDARFVKATMAKYPLYEYERATPIMHDIRSIKEQEEVDQMQRACDITKAGFEHLLGFIKPGVKEYEIQAELIREFMKRGSRHYAYEPIIASGFNACVLHYIDNDQECKDGDVILMDIGAEFGNYASDMTRCVPVNGRYTDRQKAVYNAVLNVMKGCEKILHAGVNLHEYHKEVGNLMTKELLDLKLIDKQDVQNNPLAYKKYFMHGTSHFIGLDVHDVGSWTESVRPGNCFTIEPGIYIREESLGIRLENNYLVTQDGLRDLMKDIPLEANDIEDWMNR